MGNSFRPKQFQSLILLSPVYDPLLFLTKWCKSEINSFYLKYMQEYSSKPQLTFSEVTHLAQQTRIHPNINTILSHFRHLHNSINIYELLSVIITYSSLSWENKVIMMFQVFDFDKSKSISKDELNILCRCFYRGVQIATNKAANDLIEFDYLVSKHGLFPEIHPSDSIVLPT